MKHRHGRRLVVESLEPRELPSSGPVTETFDGVAGPGLPADWTRWSNDNSAAFVTAANQGVGGSVGLVSGGTSRTVALAWVDRQQPADTAVGVSVQADSLVPVFLFARGSRLGSSTPSYLAAVVTRGLRVELVEVSDGVSRLLGVVNSPPSSYLSGQWVRLTLTPSGNTVVVRVVRTDTGQFLNERGTWQSTPAAAITAPTTLVPASGLVGVGRNGQYSGSVRLDDFVVFPVAAATPGVTESFDHVPVGSTPPGWRTWTAGSPGGFAVTAGRSVSPSRGLTSSGGSSTASRAWASTGLPADVTASVAVYLDSLVPAQLFVRGANLNGPAPTYYAASVTRGVGVQLLRVVNGVETPIGSVRSQGYSSGQWVRVRLTAQGDRLRVVVYRTDTAQWLTPDGAWSDSPDVALEVRDGAIRAGGMAGVGRGARFSGNVTFDDFEARPAAAGAGPLVRVEPLRPAGPLSGEVTFRADATGDPIRVEFRLNGVLRFVSTDVPALWTLDTATLANGSHSLVVRAIDAEGNFGVAEYQFATANPDAGPVPVPSIPRKYSHIRIAQLAYSGNPMGAFERNLLQTSVDLVVPNTRFLSAIEAVAPDTPQLIYSNVSNLYGQLLTDWLEYADRAGVSRELAFYHVTRATPFSGTSPSSQPVNWFWGVYQAVPGGVPVDHTAAARGGRNYSLTFGAAGTTTSIGYTDRFREVNVNLSRVAATGWAGVWEYPSAVDANGNPTAWRALALNQDGTHGLRQSGTITFDPPPDWQAASVGDGPRLFYVRIRTTSGTAAQAPVLRSVLGRDYVGANGTQSGVIPAFDYAADKDQDGYLSDAEYANRQPGRDARFVHESRLFYPYYGQMRFVTNPASPAVRHWAADYHLRLLAAQPLADGIFMDNALGKLPFAGTPVLEPTATYSLDSGTLLAAVSRAIAPRWVMANTAGGGTWATPVAAASAAAFEEFLLRPLQANWSQVGDVADLVQQRLNDGAPYLVLDSHPAGGSPTDPRTQLATLAYYYLLNDPQRTFVMFFGGWNPSSSWTEHWVPAAAVDIGSPSGSLRVWATGSDPANPALTFKVFARDYSNALVLYKPLSYTPGVGTGTTGNDTATTIPLRATYRVLNADGSLGPLVTSVTLRNGEGAVLLRV